MGDTPGVPIRLRPPEAGVYARPGGPSVFLTVNPPVCHIDRVTLFNFTLQRGMPIVEQLVFASIRAILRGEYRPEQPFPSVRAIASNLKIHPNTAHKVVQTLIEDGWLEARPGVGTVVAARPVPRGADRRASLRDDIDRLVVKARSSDVPLADVLEEFRSRWRQVEPTGKD